MCSDRGHEGNGTAVPVFACLWWEQQPQACSLRPVFASSPSARCGCLLNLLFHFLWGRHGDTRPGRGVCGLQHRRLQAAQQRAEGRAGPVCGGAPGGPAAGRRRQRAAGGARRHCDGRHVSCSCLAWLRQQLRRAAAAAQQLNTGRGHATGADNRLASNTSQRSHCKCLDGAFGLAIRLFQSGPSSLASGEWHTTLWHEVNSGRGSHRRAPPAAAQADNQAGNESGQHCGWRRPID